MEMQTDTLWLQSNNNLPRLLLGLSHYIQTETLAKLTQIGKHKGLRLSYTPYFELITPEGCRQKDVAQILGISKQGCNRVINELDDAGYIQRIVDPDDNRARLLILTNKGIKLKSDGQIVFNALRQQMIENIGESQLNNFIATLNQLCSFYKINKITPNSNTGGSEFIHTLFRFTDYVMQQLLKLTIEQGHPGLKQSFRYVLNYIGPNGARVQQLAAINNVSKQAISNIASAIEKLGYIDRDLSNSDGREVLLKLTNRGYELLVDTATSVELLTKQFSEVVSETKMEEFLSTLLTLKNTRSTGSFNKAGNQTNHTDTLARELIQKMGKKQAILLAASILNFTK